MKKNIFLVFGFVISAIVMSCGESDTSGSDDDSISKNEYYISYQVDGKEYRESGVDNFMFSSTTEMGKFGILDGDIRVKVFHNGKDPEQLKGVTIGFELKNGEWSSEYPESGCSCMLSEIKKEGEPMEGFGQPYRVSGMFEDCEISKVGNEEIQTATKGKFDIVLYYLSE